MLMVPAARAAVATSERKTLRNMIVLLLNAGVKSFCSLQFIARSFLHVRFLTPADHIGSPNVKGTRMTVERFRCVSSLRFNPEVGVRALWLNLWAFDHWFLHGRCGGSAIMAGPSMCKGRLHIRKSNANPVRGGLNFGSFSRRMVHGRTGNLCVPAQTPGCH